jgi:hypothetical protein
MEKNIILFRRVVKMDEIAGIILIKCNPNTEEKTTEFAKNLFKRSRGGKPCGKDCICKADRFLPFMARPDQISKKTQSKLPCKKLRLWNFSTFTGFFDFFFIVSASEMKDIEDFVIYCLRGSSGKIETCIVETQTVVGSILCQRQK